MSRSTLSRAVLLVSILALTALPAAALGNALSPCRPVTSPASLRLSEAPRTQGGPKAGPALDPVGLASKED